jgi:uncharacterized small protein (DUF1192 family)
MFATTTVKPESGLNFKSERSYLDVAAFLSQYNKELSNSRIAYAEQIDAFKRRNLNKDSREVKTAERLHKQEVGKIKGNISSLEICLSFPAGSIIEEDVFGTGQVMGFFVDNRDTIMADVLFNEFGQQSVTPYSLKLVGSPATVAVESKTEEVVVTALAEEREADSVISGEPECDNESPEPVVAKGKLYYFPSQDTGITPVPTHEQDSVDEKTPPDAVPSELEGGETEEEDWTYISLEREQQCQAIASELIKLSEKFSSPVTSFLWELKFVVFEGDHRYKSREYGTFEQMCRRLYEEEGFPYHPNTAREKANAEQERRILQQAGVTVEVEKMSDTAALELRKIDTFRNAEPEVILAAKRAVVEAAPKLTREGISSSIKSLSEAQDWENTYKFQYNPKPRKRQSGEKLEPISRQEVEEVQNRNTLLKREVEKLQSEVCTMAVELMGLKKEVEEKTKNEQFLSSMVIEKDEEIERLKRELEEARSTPGLCSEGIRRVS